MGKSYMKTILMFLAVATVMLAQAASALDVVYTLEFAYIKGEIELLEINLVQGEAPGRQLEPKEGYSARMVSDKGDLLYSLNFSIPLEIEEPHQDELNSTEPAGPIRLDETAFNLVIPYFENAKLVNIYSPEGELKLSVDISRHTEAAKTAGAETAEAPPQPVSTTPLIVIAAVAIAVIAVFAFWRRRLHKAF